MHRAHDRIDLLQTFVKIGETGSLSRAARALETSQPTVSRRLLDLERMLGCKLATRTTARFSLTDDGRSLLADARDLIDRWSGMSDRLSGVQSRPEGTLCLIAPSSWGARFVTDAITDLCADHPDLRVKVNFTDRKVDLLTSDAECWLFVGSISDQDLVVRHLGTMDRQLIATPALVKRLGAITIRNFSAMPFVSLTPHVVGTIRLYDRASRLKTVAVNSTLQMDNVLATYRAVLNGAGIGAASPWLCYEDIQAGRLTTVLSQWRLDSIPVNIALRPGAYRPARVVLFIDALKRRLAATRGFHPAA